MSHFLRQARNHLRFAKKFLKENGWRKLWKFEWAIWQKKKDVVSATVHGIPLLLRPNTPDWEVAYSCLGGEFEALALAYPRDKKGLIIDAGGYIGTAAISLSLMYPQAKIISIEPSSDNFSILKENTHPYKNIISIHAALMPEDQTSPVMLNNRGTGEWGFTTVQAPCDHPAIPIGQVATVSMRQLLEAHAPLDLMIVKMDIEGGEFSFFQSQSKWLNDSPLLIVELHERIVAGCEKAFGEINKTRFVFKTGGEKYISLGKRYFETHYPPKK